MTRTYKVKGKDEFGVELERTGDLVRLRTHTPGWPFPAERTLPRQALVWICGDPEPQMPPAPAGDDTVPPNENQLVRRRAPRTANRKLKDTQHA